MTAPITFWNSTNGSWLHTHGKPMVKQPNVVYMYRMTEDFSVETNEGALRGLSGDYVAYDPKSGYVWPVSAEYVSMHYKDA